MKKAVAFLLFSFVAFPLLAQGVVTPSSVFSVQRERLPNGMEVWIKPRPTSRAVDIRVVVKVGFRNERVEESGISHLLEHLMFKGTLRHDEITLSRMIDSKGAYSNGETWPDYTFYEVSIIDRELPLALDWLHEILTESTLTPKAIEEARKDVYSEQQGHYPKALERIFETGLFQPLEVRVPATFFPSTKIADRVSEDLDGISRKRLLQHYRNYYVPSNMAVIVVGNVDPVATMEHIRARFGSLPAKAPSPDYTLQLPSPKKVSSEISTIAFPPAGEMTEIWSGAFTSGAKDPDRDVLRVIATHLDRSAFEEVRSRRALAYSVGCAYRELADVGAVYLYANASRSRSEEKEVKAIFARLLDTLREKGIDEHDLAEAKETILGRRVRAYESNAAIAGLYQDFYLHLPFDQPIPDSFAAIDNVTADDVLRVARTRFASDRIWRASARPTLSYAEVVILCSLLIAIVITFIAIKVRRKRERIRRAW